MKLKIRVGGMLCFFMGYVACVYAIDIQGSTDSAIYAGSTLSVGDSVPNVGITPVLNYKYATVRLTDFKDKLLVLDFWATTCGSCLEAMPSIASLQSKYKGQLQIIDVDYERADYVSTYLNSHPAKKALGLPVIASDILLKKLFPYQYLPHIVWIRNGVFVGATDGDYLDEANIEKVINDKDFTFSNGSNLPGLNYDYRSPLYQVIPNNNLKATAGSFKPLSSAVLSSALPGVSLKAGWDTTSNKLRFYAINHPLLNLYAIALNSGLPFIANRRILDIRDSSQILNVNHSYADKWAAAHSYCAEITLSGDVRDKSSAMKLLQHQIEAALGVTGKICKKERSCLLLTIEVNSLHSVYSKKEISFDASKPGPVRLHRINLDDLAWLMNEQENIPPVFIDSANRTSFDLEFPSMPKTINEWKNILSANGIIAKDDKKTIDMFVLSDQPEQ